MNPNGPRSNDAAADLSQAQQWFTKGFLNVVDVADVQKRISDVCDAMRSELVSFQEKMTAQLPPSSLDPVQENHPFVIGGHVDDRGLGVTYRLVRSSDGESVLMQIREDDGEWLDHASMPSEDFRWRSRGLFLMDRFRSLGNDVADVFEGFQIDSGDRP